MARKLTASTIAAIQADRKRGASYAELAKTHAVSVGSIRNAIKAKAPAAPSSATADPPPSSSGVPTQDDLRAWLGEQCRSLRADAQRYKAEGDTAALAAANRSLIAASALLARVTPAADAGDTAGVFVGHEDMQAAAASGRAKLLERIERRARACAEGHPPVSHDEVNHAG